MKNIKLLMFFFRKMPLVGLGGYVLRSRQEPHPPISPELCGEFNKIKISTSYDKITGILFLNYDTTRTTHYDGIKIRLNSHLKPIVAERANASGSDELDLFENCPIETTLTSKLILLSSLSLTLRE